MKKRGAPKKSNDVKRTAEIKISMTQDMKNMIKWLAKNTRDSPVPTSTFLYDILFSFLEDQRFTLNVPSKATVEMREEFKNVANNLNQLTRDYNTKREYLRNSEKEALALNSEITEVIRMTKEMHRATMHYKVQPVDQKFWDRIKERMNN